MNKKTLYWIVGVVIVVIIIVILMLSGKSAPAPASGSPSVTSSSSSSGSSQSSQSGQVTAIAARQTMHDLISSGATKICTFSIAATASTSSLSGTVYMDSGSMRGDFSKTDTSDKTTSSHMIISSGTVYLWSDALSKGIKLPWSVAASSSAMLGKAGGIDVNQPTTYSCTRQTPNQSEFALPTSITFTDIAAWMKTHR
jgi:hypothetical protein